MTVAQPSTPRRTSTCLRKQNLGSEHRPLIVFTPRSRCCAARPRRPSRRTSRPALPPGAADHRRSPLDAAQVERVLLCSGKITVGADGRARQARGGPEPHRHRRMEQLYPRPLDELDAELARFTVGPGGALGAGRAGEPGPVAPHGAPPGASTQPPLLRVSRRSRRAAPSVGPAQAHVEENAALTRRRPSPGDPCTSPTRHRGARLAPRRRGRHSPGSPTRVQEFVDLNPSSRCPVERLATWLARLDDEDD